MKKRILSFVMCVIMLLSLIPMNALALDEHIHDGEVLVAAVEESAEESTPAAEDEAEEAVCTCESDDPATHAPFCALYAAPETPVCFCVEPCAEGSVNEWCDVCYFDHAACAASGEEEAVVYEWLLAIYTPEDLKEYFTVVFDSYELELCVGQEGRLPYTFEWNPDYSNSNKAFGVVPNPVSPYAEMVDPNDPWTIRGLKAGEAQFTLQVDYVILSTTIGLANFTVKVYDHSYANGFCTRCGGYEPAELVDGYYQIGNGGQMFWFANHINNVDRTASAKLTADIDLENRAWTPIGVEGGNDAQSFRGVFDGSGKTISGLYVDAQRNALGLFGEVRDGTVKNFTISGEVKLIGKHDYVGGVVGSACGTANDKGATIFGITSYVDVTLGEGSHGSNRVAGLVGYVNHNTNVENCAWYGTLDLGPYRAQDGVGGLVGKANSNYCGTIRNCGAYGTIKTSYQSLSFKEFDTIYIGGIVSNSLANAQTKIENCIWAGTIVNNTNLGTEAHISSVGTLNGFASVTGCYVLDNAPYVTTNSAHDSYATPVTAVQLASGEVAYLLQSDQTEQVWGQTIGTNNYPVLGGAKVNYGYASCGDSAVKVYSNGQVFNTKPAHNWTEKDGICTVCGKECTPHSYTNGKCTICGYECKHSYTDGKCTVCGYECEHSFTDSKCTICDYECAEHNYENCICTICGAVDTHSYDGGFCTVCDDYEPAELVDGYYEIGNAGQLYWFAKQVKAGQTSINGKLTDNIVINENVLNADGTLNTGSRRAWNPIGSSSRSYGGTFDGQNHTVSGLFNNFSGSGRGLFGYISARGTVQNVGVIDSYLFGTALVSGVAADNAGTIINCYFMGRLKCTSTGGVVCRNSGTITNCYSSVMASSNMNYGGVAYSNTGTVTNCYYNSTLYNGDAIYNNQGGTATNVEGKTTEQFKSGEVAYLLQSDQTEQVWGQTIGTEDYPILGGKKVYYAGASCDEDGVFGYSNSETPDHNWEDSKCTVCGKECTEHSYTDGKCTICGYECEHSFTDSKCTICGCECKHSFTDGKCTICGKGCTEHSYTDGVCTVCGTECDHSIDDGVCTVCGTECEHADCTNGICNVCDGYEPAKLVGDYYEIGNMGQLYWFAEQVNSGSNAINGKLTANITVNEDVLNDDGSLNGSGEAFKVWTPIGATNTRVYKGTFDGNGKTVSGLYYNNASDVYDVGFIGRLTSEGTVKNLTIADSYFCASFCVGGVVGENYGTVENCSNSGAVSGEDSVGGVVGYSNGSVIDCGNSGNVSGNSNVGGVVGNGSGTITGCYNTGIVSANAFVGGVAGQNWDVITNCYNTGIVSGGGSVGGVVGYNDGTVTNCYNTGDISDETYAGGVVGYNTNNSCTVTNCYYDKTVYSGNAIGENEGCTVTNVEGKTTEQFKSGEVAYLLGEAFGQTIGTEDYPILDGEKVYYGYDSCGENAVKVYSNAQVSDTKPSHIFEDGICTVCGMVCDHTFDDDDYCTVCGIACPHESYDNGFCAGCGVYEPAVFDGDSYLISSAGQLYWFAKQVNNGQTTINGKLTANIVVNENVLNTDGTLNDGTFRTWTPIGSNRWYEGSFDGDNHTISGLYFSDSSVGEIGLFGQVQNSTIKSVGVVDSYFSGDYDVGGVVGYIISGGTVTNCYNTGTVSGSMDVGGVVGNGSGTISGCYNTGAVSGGPRVGGVMGYNDGTMTNCYNTGNVSGSEYVGGVVGYNTDDSCAVTNCYYDSTVYNGTAIGNSYGTAAKVAGKTTEQFKSGEVAYLLSEAFGQTIGTEDYPILDGEKVYYGYDSCGEDAVKVYSNAQVSDTKPSHSFADGICTVCGAFDNTGDAKLGDNTVAIPEGCDGYYWTYIAEADGELLVTISGENNWCYVINNKTTQMWGDTQWSDSDPVVNPCKVAVSKGDELEIIVSGYDPVNFWDYPAATLTVTLEYEVPFAFYGTNMTLGNELDLNFAIEQKLVPDGAYAEISVNFADGRTDSKTLQKSEWTKQDRLYLITYKGLAAKEMCDIVTVKVYDSGNNLLGTREDSIRSYAMRCLGNTEGKYSDTVKTLFMEMLNYGAKAQEQFMYNTENLANAGCEAYTAYDKQHSAITNSGSPVEGLYMGTSLVLENRIEMQMGFTGIDSTVKAVVSYQHHDKAEAKTYELTSDKFHKYNDTTYGVIIPDIVVADGRQPVTVTLYNADGSELIKVTDSIESYVARSGDSGVYNAIMDFSDAAYEYLH